MKDHEVKASELMLYGGGGGAWAIVPAVAQQLAMDFRVTEHAEIISALGVAMGMIQETIEQSIIDPSEADLLRLRHEAVESVVRMGAQPDSVEVHVEVDARQKLVRATAQGSPELRADRQPTALSESELDEKALASYVAHAGEVNAMARTGFFSVYAQARTRRSWWGLRRAKTRVIHVLDGDGIVRLRLLDPCVHVGSLGSLSNELGQLIEEHTAYGDAGALVPDVYVLVSARIIDLSGLAHRDQVTSLLHAESEVIPSSEDAVALIVRHH